MNQASELAPRRGVLITFEGPEGSGKTTHIARLAAHLRARGATVRTTREPGGTATGDALRGVLLAREGGLDPRTELLLMVAQRVEHIVAVIEPALAAGEVVLCDRHADSSRVYQGLARGLGLELVDRLHRDFACEVRPDLTFLLDLDPAEGLRRAQARGPRQLDRIEAETRAFHDRVRAGYQTLVGREPARFVVIDSHAAPDEVFSAILAGLARLSLPSGATAGGR